MNTVIILVDSSAFGGIEAHIIELTKLLTSNNIKVKVTLLCDYQNHQLYTALDAMHCEYDALDGKLSSLYTYLKAQPNAVVHTHGYKAGIQGRILCAMLKKRCISTYHAGEKGEGRIRLYNLFDSLTSRLSSNFVVSKKLPFAINNSQFLANFVVPSNDYTQTHREQIRVAFVGRLSYEKGPDRFLNLAAHFENQQHFQFHVYGSGAMEVQLKRDASKNVTFHHHQTDKSFWQNIDVLVICSREEGLPMVLLEAMDRKVLTLSHRVGAIDTVIQHKVNGLLTELQSPTELISKLRSLIFLSNNERRYLLNNANTRLLRFYSGKTQLTQLKNAYFDNSQ